MSSSASLSCPATIRVQQSDEVFCRQAWIFKQTVCVFLNASARAVHRLLENRHHGVPWPSAVRPVTQLTNSIIKRVNEASGLYQMFSVLADIVLLRE